MFSYTSEPVDQTSDHSSGYSFFVVIDVSAIPDDTSGGNEDQEAGLGAVDASPVASSGTEGACEALRPVQVVGNTWG